MKTIEDLNETKEIDVNEVIAELQKERIEHLNELVKKSRRDIIAFAIIGASIGAILGMFYMAVIGDIAAGRF